jgi:hypothetical protein
MTTITQSSTKPGDGITAPMAIRLSTWCGTGYVTHEVNMQDGGLYCGHYFDAYTVAEMSYIVRCQKLGVAQ